MTRPPQAEGLGAAPDAGAPGHVAAADGTQVATVRWAATGPSRATVILVHGYAEHVRRYARFARRLAEAGFDVLGYDHRGHGASGGKRADVADFGLYVDDLGRVARAAESEPARRVVFGHSMGGAVATLFAARHPDALGALILSAPYLRNAVPVAPGLERVARLAARLAPGLPVQRLDAGALSRLSAEVTAYREDPAVYVGPVRARMARELLDGGRAALEAAERIAVPVRIVHGGADRIASPDGARDLAARLGARAELTVYEGGYHELLNDEERDRVAADLAAWLDARYPASSA